MVGTDENRRPCCATFFAELLAFGSSRAVAGLSPPGVWLEADHPDDRSRVLRMPARLGIVGSITRGFGDHQGKGFPHEAGARCRRRWSSVFAVVLPSSPPTSG